jgi:CheY-like chemotaxis protein
VGHDDSKRLVNDMSTRLLLVEDEPDILLIARASLKRAGFEVITARDGLAALRAVVAERPAVIVLDCMMPELDGFETCARLQADPATREIPIVFLTAKSDPSEHHKCVALGAVGCITKPFDPLRLGEQVKALVLASHQE